MYVLSDSQCCPLAAHRVRFAPQICPADCAICILIPRVGEDPMDYNHCTWLSLKDVAIGEMISVFNTDQDPLFSATMFNATLQNEFAVRVEGGSVTNLYFDKLRNIDISYPSIPEQKQIAAFFENIDNLITLHQRKYF